MKSFHISLFKSNKSLIESRIIFAFGSLGRAVASASKAVKKTAEGAKKAAKEEAEKPAEKPAEKVTVDALKKKADDATKKWSELADKPGHTKGFKAKIDGLISPLKAKWEKILKGGITKGEVASFASHLKQIEAKAVLAHKAEGVKKKAKEVKKGITKDKITKQLTEATKDLPALKLLPAEHQATALKAILANYTDKILKGIHGKIDSLVASLDSAKDGTAIEGIETQISNFLVTHQVEGKSDSLTTSIDSPEIVSTITTLNEYVKSILIVLDASGKCFTEAGIKLEGKAKEEYDKWKVKLTKMLQDGKAAPAEFIAQTQNAQTHIVAANIIEGLKAEDKTKLISGLVEAKLVPQGTKDISPAMFVKVLVQINVGYKSLSGAPDKRTKAMQAVAKLLQKAIGDNDHIKVTIQGGADSESIKYGERTIPQLKQLRAFAQKIGKLNAEQLKAIIKSCPQIGEHKESIAKLASLSDTIKGGEKKSEFVKFLENANASSKDQWFGGGGVFNTLLALVRTENTAGDILKKDSLFYQPNCTVRAVAARGKVDVKDRNAGIGLDVSLPINKGNIKIPETKDQLALKEKIKKRKEGVLKRVQKLGGDGIDANLVIDSETIFTPLNDNGGLDDAGWAKENKEYVRTAKFQDKTITFGISTSSPHQFTVSMKGKPKIPCSDKKDLQSLVTSFKEDIGYNSRTEELTIDQEDKVDERKSNINYIISTLGGKSMDKPLTINGLKFTFYTLEAGSANWVVGDGVVSARAVHKGKIISFSIGVSEPHPIYTYDENGSMEPGIIDSHKETLEKKLKATKSKIDKVEQEKDDKELIAKNKKGVMTVLATAGAISTPEGFNIQGVEFGLAEFEDKDYLQSDKAIPLIGEHKGVTIIASIGIGEPHKIVMAVGTNDMAKGGANLSTAIKRAKAHIDAQDEKTEPIS